MSTQVIEEEATTTRENTSFYPMWKVLIHNDTVTTMQFVMRLLMVIFHHEYAQAHHIMMEAHHDETALAGVFTKEVAELKVEQSISMARAQKFPLAMTIEPAD